MKSHRIKWKWKQNLPEALRHSKGSAKKEFIAMRGFIKNLWAEGVA
jgi:hypothetical protein